MLEQDLIKWLASKTSLPAHYQHLNKNPGSKFIWFIRNGDEDLDCLDDEVGLEPDIVYFDVEIYEETPIALQQSTRLLKSGRGYRGILDSGASVEDISISDQRDDYEPQANAESLPPYMSAFRVVVTCYQSAS